MSKYSNIAIVASFFGLWLDSFFSNCIGISRGGIFRTPANVKANYIIDSFCLH